MTAKTMTTTTTDIIHGKPEEVMGQLALHVAHGRLLDQSQPVPVPGTSDQIAVKVTLRHQPQVTPAASTALAVRQSAVPARAPLRHPAAKPGWSAQKKLAVGGGAVLGISGPLGWLVSQLLKLDLQAMAATAVGFVALIAIGGAMLRAGAGAGAGGGGGGGGRRISGTFEGRIH